MDQNRQLNVWYLSDGKPGHQNQVLGLLDSMSGFAEQLGLSIQSHCIEVQGTKLANVMCLASGFKKLYPNLDELSASGSPHVIMAAGSSTHIPAYLTKREFGLQEKNTLLVILMKPSLPFISYDVCIAPHHDGMSESHKVWVTEGVINHVKPSARKREDQGLMLIGGPSKHHGWSDLDIVGQIQNVLGQNKDMYWHVTNSRRTPLETTKLLDGLKQENVEFLGHEFTNSEWMQEVFQICGQIWVSEDSASMVSEAITSGASVGIFSAPLKHANSRVVRGVRHLAEEGLVMTYQDWLSSKVLNTNAATLNESERIGMKLMDKVLNHFRI